MKQINATTRLHLSWIVLVITVTAAQPSFVSAQVVLEKQGQLARIDIVEHLGDTIPLDLSFTADNSVPVELQEYFRAGKPVVVVLGYYECPMLCNLVFNGLTNAMAGLKWTPGEEYEVITVSIDPGETVQLAQAKKANYTQKLNKEGAEKGWHFLVGADDQSSALAEAIGFEFFYDEGRDEYAHPAAVYILTEDGVISRYLYGIEIDPKDLRLALLEASDGKIGSTVDRLILYCYQYDPLSQGYVVFAANVMRIAGAVMVVLLALFLGTLWVRDRRRHSIAGISLSEVDDERDKVRG